MDQHPNLGWRLGWDLLIHPTLVWYIFYLELKVALDSSYSSIVTPYNTGLPVF